MVPRLLYAGSTYHAPWPLGPRTEAWKPIGVTSRAIVVPRWSRETPDQVWISGCAAASFACIIWVRCTAKRSMPPVGVGTLKVLELADPTFGAFLNSDRTASVSTVTAE